MSNWDERYGELKRYKEQFGDCNVPQDFVEQPKLGRWVTKQRAHHANNKLPATRKTLLDELGFVWDLDEFFWDSNFAELKRYKEKFGDCNVPHRWSENPQLATWVSNQRARKDKLSVEKKAELNGLGFLWEPRDVAWETMLGELRRYKEQHGHCNVSHCVMSDRELARWVTKQRVEYDNNKLSVVRKSLLDALGFVWDPLESDWEKMFDALESFKDEKGHCDVPQRWVSNPQLASWVRWQRQALSKGKVSPERKARLDALGFNWNPQEVTWERSCMELMRFKETQGHCNVPSNWPEDPKLSAWVSTQRRFKKAKKLSSERTVRLDDLGFIWNPEDAVWKTNLAKLARFKDKHGHCNVPRGFEEDGQLGTWVTTLRTRQSKGSLSAEEKSQLDALGFIWNPRDAQWEANFAKLVRFKETYGHCAVPTDWSEDPQLGTWVNTLRARRAKLSVERTARLDALGFVWDGRDFLWEAMFAQLGEFKDKHGHCNVTQLFPENRQLGTWVTNQRAFQNRGKLSPNRKAQLDELGFIWEPNGGWEAMLAELRRYKERFGHCNVPTKWSENPRLGAWVSKQRQRAGKLSRTHKERLEVLGFEWSCKSGPGPNR